MAGVSGEGAQMAFGELVDVDVRGDGEERLNQDLRVIRERLKALYNEYALEEQQRLQPTEMAV